MPVTPGREGSTLSSLDGALHDVACTLEELPGVAGARAAVRRGALFGGTDEVPVVVAAGSGDGAARALQAGLSRIGELVAGR